jgi:putative redox protein
MGEGLRFEAPHPHHRFETDGDTKSAYSPVQHLLLALASCTAADVIDIATKMRVPISGLELNIDGDRNEEPPRYFKAIRMRYVARGVADDDRPKIQRAVELSHEKYCSVSHSLRKDIVITSELEFA